MAVEVPFEDVYKQHVDAVFAFCASRLGREYAEDVTADVFCRALGAWDRYEDRGLSPRPWLMQIAYRQIVEHWRRSGRVEAGIDGADEGPSSVNVESEVEVRDELSRVMPGLAELPELQRTVLSMRFLGELSVAETAAALGSNEEAVRSATLRGLRTLRSRFSGSGVR